MLCYCVIKAFPDLFTLRGRNRTRLPLPSLTLNRGPFTGTESFPILELFLVIGLKKDGLNLVFVSIKDFQDSSETKKMTEGQE